MLIKFLKCLLTFSIINEYLAQSCRTFSCNQNNPVNTSSQCIFSNSTTNVYSQCQPNQICAQLTPSNLNSLADYNCTNVPNRFYSNLSVGGLADQDYCVYSTNCVSNNCENNICVGYSANAFCIQSKECGGSLFCNIKNRCVTRGTFGSNCSDDASCQNAFGCLNGQCANLFSIPIGNDTTIKNDSIASKFCVSNFSVQGICEDLIAISNTSACQGSCQYISSISNVSVSRPCVCDFYGNSVCALGTNTTEYSNYTASIINLYNTSSGSTTCSYYNKLRCAITSGSLWDAYNTAAFAWNGIKNYSDYLGCLATNLNTPTIENSSSFIGFYQALFLIILTVFI